MTPQRKPGKSGRVPFPQKIYGWRKYVGQFPDDGPSFARVYVERRTDAPKDATVYLLAPTPTSAGERRGAALERAVVKAAMNNRPSPYYHLWDSVHLRGEIKSPSASDLSKACCRLEIHRRSQRGRKS